MANARKVVRWAYDMANSSLGSPDASLHDLDATLESDLDSGSGSLAYVNAQLLAHGFAHGDGLDLDGLDAGSAKAVVKCILGLLSQRANDVSRTEELTTKYRTLSYDHERLLSLYRTALDKTAKAEQDSQRFKARLAVSQRDLATAETQRKAAMADLSRTRTAMQYLRTTSQQELKRLEKDKQTFCDRFTKISDAQAQLGAASSGMYFSGAPAAANAAVLDGSSIGGGVGILETSLRAAEEARRLLMQENEEFREVMLFVANRLQEATHDATAMAQGPDTVPADLPPLKAAQLFSPPTSTLSNAQNAHAKLLSLSNDLRDALTALGNSVTSGSTPSQTAQAKEKEDARQSEIERLQSVVEQLKAELEKSKTESATFVTQSQALFDRFAADEHFTGAGTAQQESSFQVPGTHDHDELQLRLEEQQQQLDEERRKFTDAAVNLGRQRAELEAARLAFLEEKRSWQVQQILAELPPTPAISTSPLRRSVSTKTTLPVSKPFPSSSSLDSLLRPQVQPPPSVQEHERDDIPPRPDSPSPARDFDSADDPPMIVPMQSPPRKSPPRKSPKQKHVAFAVGSSPLKQRRSPPRSATHRVMASPGNHLHHNTPGRPGSAGGIFASKPEFKHAYSPARPSPLSRIMMLADDSSVIQEQEEEEDGYETEDAREEDERKDHDEDQDDMFPALPSAQRSPTRASFPAMPASLATELHLGASGQHPAARTRLSLPASIVSFDFAAELDLDLPSPSGSGSGSSLDSKEPPPPKSTTPPTASDSSDEDLRLVAGTTTKGGNKENKRPRRGPAVPAPAPAPATKVAPPPKPRVPLSPRKIKSAQAIAAKRVPVPVAPSTKRISPVPPPTTKRISPIPHQAASTATLKPPVVAKPPSRPTSAAARPIAVKTTGAKRVPVSGWK
ncbi:hypothetical protein EXIGLDRAFT_833344 [Exidia glandulosa HHB12029]|uniref:Uncharacterized protein n=1 Tax=Exidia glandulosa HHB12029 TaxID=1314781 RepID=A0A165KRN5_EXIGL|nr:hypothetical protein EXIGLDRAFT_833344 [Exidia glandulosa HHB12029]